jgi:hypothetical protein
MIDRIDMKKIEKVNEKYNLNIKQISVDSALVTTGLGEWLIEVTVPSEYNKQFIKLKHRNTRHDKSKFHMQRRFYDYEWTLGHIHCHDFGRFKN